MTRRSRDTVTTELVWDRDRSGTALSAHGAIQVGHGSDWTPESLLALAAETSVMRTFLALAHHAGVEVLGYVSTAHLHRNAQPPHITVSPCIVVATERGRRRAESLLREMPAASLVARMLGPRLRVEPEVRVVAAGEVA